MLNALFERVVNALEVSHSQVPQSEFLAIVWDTGTLGAEASNRFSPGRGCACVRPRAHTRIHSKYSVPSVPCVPNQGKKPGTLCGTLSLRTPSVSHLRLEGGRRHV